MNWILPLSLLIIFELVADVLAKNYSLNGKMVYAIAALLAYVVANIFWLFALKNGSGLAKGAIIFSIASAVIAVGLGYFLYRETITPTQIAGIILGLVALVLIFWG